VVNRIAIRYALLAFVTHAIVVALSLVPSLRSESLLAGDAITYLMPAENIVHHGSFSREALPPFVWEPYRTPGYPLLIAASIAMFGTHAAVLFVAALTSGLGVWCAVRLTAFLGGTNTALHASGAIGAFLPNSLGLSAMMLTDAIGGHLFLVWLYLVVTGCRTHSWSRLGASALVMNALQSLKPTFFIAGVLVVLAVMLFDHGRRKIPTLAALLLLTLPLPFYFASRNFEAHGVRSGSLLGIETVREYLYVRYLQETTGEDYAELTRRVRAQDRLEAQQRTSPPSPYGRLYMVKDEKVKQFFREHPFAALRLMATEMLQQFAAPQEFFPQVFVGDLPNWGRGLGSLLSLTLWGCAALGGYTLWKQGNKAPALMTAGVLLFFLLTGSVSHAVGARLRFPADMAAVPLMGVGGGMILGMLPSLKRLHEHI